jgi:fructosamine-3-kinase
VTKRADPAVAARLAHVAGTAVREMRAGGSQHGQRHYRAVLADGRAVFVKVGGDPAALEAEALGLRWLREPGVAPVPEVLGWDDSLLAITWLAAATPKAREAERFGRDLARLHRSGAGQFGSPWPGYIASLPFPAGPGAPSEPAEPGGPGAGWPQWYASHRVLPFVRLAVDAGTLSRQDARVVETAAGRFAEVAGPAEPPSRIHGDLWSGNVLWSGGRGWLIDPAAHGGHRETDLAMLALFGAPFLDTILGAYADEAPLAPGWRQRVPLHQLHPLLVHVCLFGDPYRVSALAAARAVLTI